MASVIITIPEAHDEDEVPSLLRYIADQIEGGFTSGYHPRWTLDESEDN